MLLLLYDRHLAYSSSLFELFENSLPSRFVFSSGCPVHGFVGSICLQRRQLFKAPHSCSEKKDGDDDDSNHVQAMGRKGNELKYIIM